MREYLIDFHMERQKGRCAIGEEDISDFDRWALRIDRYPIKGEDGGRYTEDNTRLICLDHDWELEDNAPNSPAPEVRTAYERYKLHNQIAGDFTRRIKAMSGQAQNTTLSPYLDPAELLPTRDTFREMEAQSKKDLQSIVRNRPEWEGFMREAPYMAERTAGFLLGHIDIHKATTVSKVWRYLGLDPTEPYNPGKGKMRAPLYAALNIGLIRKDSPYRAKYDEYRAKDVSHGGAIRRLIKLWLSHLWDTWRRYEGLPVTKPYVNEHKGHTGFLSAQECGWP